ncbi:hypothetical protein N7471_005266 [Penicillium samsonianum]|uniref:uncharacterized protein n=1 Tax=Penicillium samsonianum TaxID=1882272 RepID=UPI002546BE26|nr:uncharacterized protein N7471_005266 [Penicillium samsonianum]KAJ6138780.1 hypothetical protein N7471_005266 [Penicillium samsonianum]
MIEGAGGYGGGGNWEKEAREAKELIEVEVGAPRLREKDGARPAMLTTCKIGELRFVFQV